MNKEPTRFNSALMLAGVVGLVGVTGYVGLKPSTISSKYTAEATCPTGSKLTVDNEGNGPLVQSSGEGNYWIDLACKNGGQVLKLTGLSDQHSPSETAAIGNRETVTVDFSYQTSDFNALMGHGDLQLTVNDPSVNPTNPPQRISLENAANNTYHIQSVSIEG
jgi:hypothetical protein